jgi:uncharacterized protein (TIGR02598 family)
MAGPASLRAFSLTEVVLALGVVSFALIATLGLIPLGLTSLKDSIQDTSNSLLVESVRQTLAGFPMPTTPQDPEAQLSLYFDDGGKYLGESLTAESFYCVSVKLALPDPPIPNAGNVWVALLSITWPAQATPTPANTYKTSFYVAPNTGSGWKQIDPAYQEKMGL